MRKQKASLALFFAGILVTNILGYGLFSLGIVTHKKLVFNSINSGKEKMEELFVLSASSISDARWENKREFEWKHEMYDVVKTEQVDGLLIYTCKKDAKEDDLKDQRKKTADKKMGDLVKIFVQEVQFFSTKFIHVPMVGLLKETPNHYSFHYSLLFHPPPLV